MWPDLYLFSCVIKACVCWECQNGSSLHGLVSKFNLGSDESIAKSNIDMHVKCGAVDYADGVFLRIPNPSLFVGRVWFMAILSYVR